jgi:hypothetical protein
MILTLRNFYDMEVDIDWNGPRAKPGLLPLDVMYYGRVFGRHIEREAYYVERSTDDLSTCLVVAQRRPPGLDERAVAATAPAVDDHPSTDQDELAEIE